MGKCCSKLSRNRNIPENIDIKSIKSFVPPINSGRVIKCYDGDTITVASYLPYKESDLYKFSVRLNGIDCPEIKSNNEKEKMVAKIAKDILSDKILGKIVTLNNVTTEKYGRILADVIFENVSLGQWLIEQNLAVSYSGGKKKTPNDWLEYYNEKNNLKI